MKTSQAVHDVVSFPRSYDSEIHLSSSYEDCGYVMHADVFGTI